MGNKEKSELYNELNTIVWDALDNNIDRKQFDMVMSGYVNEAQAIETFNSFSDKIAFEEFVKNTINEK